MAGMNRRVPQGKKLGKEQLGLLKRLGAYVFRDYGRHCLAVVILILVSVLANVQGTMFMRNLIDDYITPFLLSRPSEFFTACTCNRKSGSLLCHRSCFYLSLQPDHGQCDPGNLEKYEG